MPPKKDEPVCFIRSGRRVIFPQLSSQKAGENMLGGAVIFGLRGSWLSHEAVGLLEGLWLAFDF